MKGCLIVFQDFHPLLKPPEIITHTYSLLNLFPPTTTPLVTTQCIEDLDMMLLFLCEGQKIYIPQKDYFVSSIREKFYIVFTYRESKSAYININNLQFVKLQLSKNTHNIGIEQIFLMIQAIKDALERGLNNIQIAVGKIFNDLSFTSSYDILLIELQTVIQAEQKSISISLIVENSEDLAHPWVQEVQNKFSQPFFQIEFIPIERIYQIRLGVNFSHPINRAVFITSYQHETNSTDYDFYLNYVKKNNIPYDIISNEISITQNLPVNKEVILDYFYYKLSLLKLLV